MAQAALGVVGTYVVGEVAQTAECEDEEVDLLDELALARLIICIEVLPQSRSCHGRRYQGALFDSPDAQVNE
jgi:hypothetical protein